MQTRVREDIAASSSKRQSSGTGNSPTVSQDSVEQPRDHELEAKFENLFFESSETELYVDSPTSKASQLGRRPRSRGSLTDWKLCGTLLGPPTLFIPESSQAEARQILDRLRRAHATPHVCVSILCPACASTADIVRERLAIELDKFGSTQARAGQYTFFRVGTARGALHSEPKMDCDRVFINVVPGTEDEVKMLASKWGVEYPRAWSFGVVEESRGYVGDLIDAHNTDIFE